MKKAGFSLLEVVLALAILTVAIGLLGEASHIAMRNAAIARDLARAQTLCETKLAEILTGITPTDSVQGTFDAASEGIDSNEPAWLYSIESQQTDETGLISVRVTVKRDQPAAQYPVEFSLVRWLPDPNATSSSTSTSSSSSSGNNTSGS